MSCLPNEGIPNNDKLTVTARERSKKKFSLITVHLIYLRKYFTFIITRVDEVLN